MLDVVDVLGVLDVHTRRTTTVSQEYYGAGCVDVYIYLSISRDIAQRVFVPPVWKTEESASEVAELSGLAWREWLAWLPACVAPAACVVADHHFHHHHHSYSRSPLLSVPRRRRPDAPARTQIQGWPAGSPSSTRGGQ